MSWFSEAVRKVAHGETKAERNARRRKEQEEAKLRAIGPSPQGDINLQSQMATETAEQRRRRLARAATFMRQGGMNPDDDLTLSRRGLLAK